MTKKFDLEEALTTYIENNGVKPEEFSQEDIEQCGFHGEGTCRIGSGEYESDEFVLAAMRRRLSGVDIGNDRWHIVALHVIREHQAAEFGAEFALFMDHHIAHLIAQGKW